MASQPERRGDPAFAGDDRITHEPVVEEERESPLPSRPFSWAVAGVVLAFAIAAVVAGVAAGAVYVIPFAVLGAIAVGFVVSHRQISRNRRDDSSDPIPNLDFEADTPLGATDESSDAERQAHADPGGSTGQR
jgi:hypothetical protein